MSNEDLYNKLILLQSKINKLTYEYRKKVSQVKRLERENFNLKDKLEKQRALVFENSLTKEKIANYIKSIDACVSLLEDINHEK